MNQKFDMPTKKSGKQKTFKSIISENFIVRSRTFKFLGQMQCWAYHLSVFTSTLYLRYKKFAKEGSFPLGQFLTF